MKSGGGKLSVCCRRNSDLAARKGAKFFLMLFALQYSDIDMAVVSDDFVGSLFDDSTRLGKYVIKTSFDIEVHPFRTEDFTPDNPLVAEILRTGKRIQWN